MEGAMRSLDDLSHTSRKLPSGGEVFVLDRGDLIGPEAQAMLGAMYSRSADGFRTLIEKVRSRGPERFMQTFYVGYGHNSIGDLGDVAIFVDGVSMLAAKAIQDFPLYRGQESSTRYIDFSKQPFIGAAGKAGDAILEGWRAFYVTHFPAVESALAHRFPRQEGEDERTYAQAIKARAFDTMRGFLPAGALTNVAWMGDLRHVRDHLVTLRNHPLVELRGIATAIEDALVERYPSSFSKHYPATERYADDIGLMYGYYDEPVHADFELAWDGIDRERLARFMFALEERPPKAELPYAIRECGMLRFAFKLDFGSFRDLQRHRSVAVRMPLVRHAAHLADRFEPWYLDRLPQAVRIAALELFLAQDAKLQALPLPEAELQYYLPMGTLCDISLAGDFRALTYLVELRATRFVHPTLRRRARQMADTLVERFGGSGLMLHLDQEPDRFDIKRGTHDVLERANA
jgi:thymidylate synthase ThyX